MLSLRTPQRSVIDTGMLPQANGREFRCPKCGLKYNRDLNSAINIAHALMRGMGWGSSEPPKLPNEVLPVKGDRTGEAIVL